jgi:hypothetical protein
VRQEIRLRVKLRRSAVALRQAAVMLGGGPRELNGTSATRISISPGERAPPARNDDPSTMDGCASTSSSEAHSKTASVLNVRDVTSSSPDLLLSLAWKPE